MKTLAFTALCVLLSLSLTVSYLFGKRAADRWWQAHLQEVKTDLQVAGTSPSSINGEYAKLPLRVVVTGPGCTGTAISVQPNSPAITGSSNTVTIK